MEWNEKEMKLIVSYFNNNTNEITLYTKLFKLNPNRTLKAVTSKLERMRKEGFSKNRENAIKNLRVGYLDIEATQLSADFGFILSWYIKEKGKNNYDYAVVKKEEIFSGNFDKRVVIELLAAMGEYDVLYTHYGADHRFDVPFIRTRALRHGFENKIPKTGLFIMDTYPIAKHKLRLHSNRLDSIANAIGIKGVKKTPLSGDVWVKASIGDKNALEYVALHNKRDVQLLERVHNRLSSIEKPRLTSI